MANDFYTASGTPGTGAFGSSAAVRSEFDLVQAAFDKMPALGVGSANCAVVLDGGGTALTTTPGTLTLNGNLSVASGKTCALNASLTLAGVDGKTLTVNNSLTLAGTDGKVLTLSNSLTFTGTDGSSVAFGTGGTVLYANSPTIASPTITGNALINQQSAKFTDLGNKTGSFNIDLSLTPFYKMTLTGNATPSFINCPNNANYVYQFFVLAIQDGVGGHSLTLPGNWPGGSQPSNTTTASKGDLWAWTTYDGGSTYIGSLVAPNVTP